MRFKPLCARNVFFFSSLRPFERTITMQKDSNGYIGFVFKDGRIKSLVKDSSAARNGLLTDHQLIEIGGQNCVGLKVSHFKVTLLHSTRSKFTIIFQVNFCITRLVKNLRREVIGFFKWRSIRPSDTCLNDGNVCLWAETEWPALKFQLILVWNYERQQVWGGV